MWLWHLGQWARWGKWDLLGRSMPSTYERFLPTSIERAERQGYKGARWGKMSDPTGRSAPGEINSLLIWQQPHPMHFAEYEYCSFPNNQTLQKWDRILYETAEFMASYAFWNITTNVCDLGPPLYPMSENTNPKTTTNTTFDLAYWKFALQIASNWQTRQSKPVPHHWNHVSANLAPLPTVNNTYPIHRNLRDMWRNETYTSDHPSMLGIHGWLPPTASKLNLIQNTTAHVHETWNLTHSFGWDFPLLAMNSVRLGDVEGALELLLHPGFEFDDAGFAVGGARVAKPYFPGGASLLRVVATMVGGWDGEEGEVMHFPLGWGVVGEGFTRAL